MKKEIHEKSILLIEGERVPYRIIFTGRKTTSITIHPNRSVIVRAPLRSNRHDLETWIKGRIPWISRHLKDIREKEFYRPENSFTTGDFHYFLGNKLTIQIISSDIRDVKIMKNKILIYSNTKHPEENRSIFNDALKNYAADFLSERLNVCFQKTENYRLSYPKLRFRRMKSRWGSCSLKAGITLNTRLMHLPVKLIDHVILHELCHLRIQNHGKDFYQMLSSVDPDWKENRNQIGSFAQLILPGN
ncbi:MAG: M48 family metallopeptidase [Spirochaetia bacterium]|nr:M48 family metallopeptidase [Spirochaetia bacterium]